MSQGNTRGLDKGDDAVSSSRFLPIHPQDKAADDGQTIGLDLTDRFLHGSTAIVMFMDC